MTTTTKKERVFNPNDYAPKRFGLNYNPPQIIIEYLMPSTGKLYHHTMRLHKFTKEKKTIDALKELIDRHGQYLSQSKISSAQLIKLIEKLKANLKQKKQSKENTKEPEVQPKPKEVEKVEKVEEKEEDEDEYNFDDLNKLEDDAVNEKKNQMEKFYKKNSIKEGDENFQYDVRKDFDHDEYAAEWDDDSY